MRVPWYQRLLDVRDLLIYLNQAEIIKKEERGRGWVISLIIYYNVKEEPVVRKRARYRVRENERVGCVVIWHCRVLDRLTW